MLIVQPQRTALVRTAVIDLAPQAVVLVAGARSGRLALPSRNDEPSKGVSDTLNRRAKGETD
jgi:hypothetical protein